MTRTHVKLSELLTPIDQRDPGKNLQPLSVSERVGIVRQDSLFKKQIALSDRRKYRVVEYGDLAYNPFLLWNGAAGVCFLKEGGCVSPAYVVLRPSHADIEYFLHYLFRSEELKARVSGIASGTVTRRRVAPLEEVLSLEFDLPDLGTMREFNRILGSLDLRMDACREAGNGAADTILCLCELVPAEAAPPEYARLGTLVRQIKEPVGAKQVAPETPYVGLEHLPQGSPVLSEWSTAGDVKSGTVKFKSGDILYGKLRPNLRKVAIAPIDGVCSTEILVLRVPAGGDVGVALGALSSDNVYSQALAGTTGTRMPRVHWDHLVGSEIKLPSEALNLENTHLSMKLAEFIVMCARQIRVMKEIRELLVPLALHGSDGRLGASQ